MPREQIAKEQAITTVVMEIRRMISSGELLPGHQIRQESMAEKLGVSRLPVREGLRQLTADGLVTHTPNIGYAVARLSADEFAQIYRMRRLLETEILMGLPPVNQDDMSIIVGLNDEVIAAADAGDVATMRTANHGFHFAIFDLSAMELIVREIERLWTLASPYHAVYLYSAESRRQILAEHELMIEALRTGDNTKLAKVMDQHRHNSGESVIPIIMQGGHPLPAR